MKIDGKYIASEIKEYLKKQISQLKSRNITPHLAVVLVGSDPSSLSYIKQKQKVGDEIGVRVTLHHFPQSLQFSQLVQLVKSLNSNQLVHGIIIQRPVPPDINKDELNRLVIPTKDVDGFHPNSQFTPPIALALLYLLTYIFEKPKMPILETKLPPKRSELIFPEYYASSATNHNGWRESEKFGIEDFHNRGNLIDLLKLNKILIIGRGVTGGRPIADTFKKMKIPFLVAHSKTNNLKDLCLSSDIIISAVGKSNVVRRDMLTRETVLIGVGLHQEEGKLIPDYNQDEISDSVGYYTPVPGGVGPVNVACLFENLLEAVDLSLRRTNK